MQFLTREGRAHAQGRTSDGDQQRRLNSAVVVVERCLGDDWMAFVAADVPALPVWLSSKEPHTFCRNAPFPAKVRRMTRHSAVLAGAHEPVERLRTI